MSTVWRRYLSSFALILLCSWLVIGGGTPDPFEKGLTECLDPGTDGLDPEEQVCALVIGFATGGGGLTSSSVRTGTSPITFEPNLGQVAGRGQFAARGSDYTAVLAPEGVSFRLADRMNLVQTNLSAKLINNNSNAQAETLEPQPGRVNYLYGNDPDKWITDVPVFGRVKFKGVYPGIDVVYYGHEGWIEHDFIVQPGADPSRIQMKLEGATETTLDAEGNLSVRVGARTITWNKPALYQEGKAGRRSVEGRYRLLADNSFGFETGRFDPARPLIIDPVVTFSTLVGGTVSDGGSRMAIDANGNSYLVGITVDTNFAVTPGTYASPAGGARNGDVIVTKLNSTGSQMVYTTHLGGAFLDGAIGVAVDSAGNAYLAGATKSQDYPTTQGAFQTTLQGTRGQGSGLDCVVTKLNASGSGLSYSSYLGGNRQDACIGIAVDSTGSAYVTGWTSSTNFPTSDNAPQRQNRGGNEVFITKFNPAGSALTWSTLMGGTRSEEPTAIAIDSQNNAYVVGHTNSNLGFPITSAAYQRAYGGTSPQAVLKAGDAFVAKLNSDGAAFGYVTYLGGNGDDIAGSVAVDGQGNAYVAGSTTSTNFPTTPQAVRSTFQGTGGNSMFPGGDAFVTKLNPTGSSVVYSTYLGGSNDDWSSAIAVDSAGNAWIAGATLSTNFPVSQDALQRTYGGFDSETNFNTGDAFLTQISPTGTAIVYSTYWGGSGDDFAMGVVLDRANSVYLSGTTRSRNFPTTSGASQTQYGGQNTVTLPLGDGFIAKFGSGANPDNPSISVSGYASAASYAGGGVAPGEMIVVTGTSIGPSTLATYSLNAARDTVSSLVGGTRFLFDDVPAPIIYVSGVQSSVLVPYAVSGRQSTNLVVEYNGRRSPPITIPVLAAKPALFSANASGRGPGAIVNILNDGSFSFNSATPAAKGSIVLLFGTGEGQTTPPGADGKLALLQFPRPSQDVRVTIGGVPADILYAGTAPQQVAGFFQMNVKVPETVPSGNLEVIVQVGNARSQSGLTVGVR